jgi:hypothetical protein
MDTTPIPELDALTAKFEKLRRPTTRKSAVIPALSKELLAAYHVGFTRKEIWEALAAKGYAGSYAQFTRSCSRILEPYRGLPTAVPEFTSISREDRAMPSIDGLSSKGRSQQSAGKEGETSWERITRQGKFGSG